MTATERSQSKVYPGSVYPATLYRVASKSFIGRDSEIAELQAHLDFVRERGAGRMVAMRGRRQIGKSRLVEEFIRRSGVDAVFYTASKQSGDDELRIFGEQLALLDTPGGRIAQAGPVGSWEAALSMAATGASVEAPIIIVIDELPFLIESESAIEAILQKQWDRGLERLPVLLLLVGSDVSMMEALDDYGRPLHGRFTEMVVQPLSPNAISSMLSLSAVAALDTYLVIGGFPRLAEIWHRGDDVWKFLRREFQNPQSPLIVLGERSLNAEFPAAMKARDVIEAIGSGERSFTTILGRAGVSNKTLETTLESLTAKRVIRKALPYSTTPRPKLSRYYIVDPYLRFWLRFIRPNLPTIERGRADLVYEDVRAQWQPYAGQAIEPIVRGAVENLLPDPRFTDARFVGGYWTRDNSIEVDLVGGRGDAVSDTIDFVGSIKWRDNAPFNRHDLSRLIEDRAAVPGATSEARLVGVSRSGFTVEGLDVLLDPQTILNAFPA
jgi:AAA+ ATPase superfamily predicted ATPase